MTFSRAAFFASGATASSRSMIRASAGNVRALSKARLFEPGIYSTERRGLIESVVLVSIYDSTPLYCSRSAFFLTLPMVLRGSCSAKNTRFGALKSASLARTEAMTRSSVVD